MSLNKNKTLMFEYVNQQLLFNGHSILSNPQVLNYTEPFFLYDLNLIQQRLNWINEWTNLGRLHFAMKSNYNEDILKLIQKNGCGVDVVSFGEIQLALKCGFKSKDILFSGVGKTKSEIHWAVQNQIYQINVESVSELKRVQDISNQLKLEINIGIRLNPEIDAKTHPNIATALIDSKFGLNISDLPEALNILKNSKYICFKALSFHIGSQVMDVNIFADAIEKIKPIYIDLQQKFKSLDRFDLGGGLGLDYTNHDLENDYENWQKLKAIYEQSLKEIKAVFLIEMGRFIVARSAVLVAQVQYIKKTQNTEIAILDVGMNNLMRPMLYQAYHQIFSLIMRHAQNQQKKYSVVGPLCESSDVFHKEILLSELRENDFVIIADVGAYAKSMSSNYNLQPIAKDYFF